ncbi:major facilitator superfamily domain-containing protein 9-like [Adelges cooleyi]|uniref:major facilitator superfamily domain-containing protein 9-like n=1 Tax=Adelges cooleyi TaxID=133065 RepID=UPI0021801A9A|nr:major facilitator superfamily domain-containing protein 9-like [Adelges cooleyi]
MFEYFYIYTIGFLDTSSLGLIMPGFNRHLREIGASHFQITTLESFFSGLQMITSPIVGTLSDRYGRKRMLTLSMMVSVIGFFCIGQCYTYLWLAIIRIILGCLKHTQMLDKSLIGDNVPKDLHLSAHGRLNSFTSLAFMISPVIGGRMLEQPNGFYNVACLTSLVCTLNVIIIVCCVPDKKIKSSSHKKSMLSNLKELDWAVYWPLLFMRIMYTATLSTLMTTLYFVLKETYKLDSSHIGYTISYISSIGVATGFFVTKLASAFHSYSTFNKCFYSFLLLSFGYFCFAFEPSLLCYLLFTIPVSTGGTLIEVFLNQLVSEHCDEKTRGTVEGAMAGASGVARFISPMIIGIAMDKFGACGAYAFASIAALSGAMVAKFYDYNKIKSKIT